MTKASKKYQEYCRTKKLASENNVDIITYIAMLSKRADKLP